MAGTIVLRALGLGDLLASVPALRAVDRAGPGPKTIGCPTPLRDILVLAGLDWQHVHVAGLATPPVWPQRPSIAVNLHGSGPQSHRMVAAAAPDRLVAFANPSVGHDGPCWDATEHERDRWCRLVREGLGSPADPADLRLERPAGRAPVRRPIVLHPGAAAPSRQWPVRRYATVARRLRSHGPVVLTGTAAERPLCRAVCDLAGLPATADMSGHTDVTALARLVCDAALVVSGDTGVAHLAVAYARPSVTLFGLVPPSLWGPPPSPRHRVLYRPDPHVPGDSDRGDPHGTRIDPRLARLQVDAVMTACEQALDSAHAHGRPVVERVAHLEHGY